MIEGLQDDGRLVILGGGIAALTSAFYASEPEHQRVFPGGIHVFEKSLRLGGKGASGRSDADGVANRIEEHGLHVWFGFYDNAFALLTKCHEYLEAEAARGYQRWATSLRSVEDGFRACNRVALMDHDGAGWLPWVADFPEDSTSRPWHPRPNEPLLGSPTELAARALRMIEAFLYSLSDRALTKRDAYATFLDPSLLPNPVRLPDLSWLGDALDANLRSATAQTGALELVSRALGLLATLMLEARSRFDQLLREHDALRRGWYIADLLLAAVRGLIDDGVLHTGDFSLIDDSELRAWLVLHGASEESVSCGFLKAIVYDLAFAYQNGDPATPCCSAATGVYGLLRVLLTFRGALMWKMNAGMGEIVFSPIYEALRRRGVHFHFGMAAAKLQLAKARAGVRAKQIVFQPMPGCTSNPKLESLDVEKGPLAGKLPYWALEQPSGKAGKLETLELGPHDMVVYGLPVGTLHAVVPNAPSDWQACADKVQTVATMCMQLWLTEPVNRYAPWSAPDITAGSYTEPFDTWSDMHELAGEKAHDQQRPIRSVAYFTNVAPGTFTRGVFDESFDERKLDEVVEHFTSQGLTGLWPEFAPSMVIGRYQRLNKDSSAAYTLSVNGTLRARLSPQNKSIANVRPVGDWTRNCISAGCIEAAVISGMIAALDLRPDRPLEIFGETPATLRRYF